LTNTLVPLVYDMRGACTSRRVDIRELVLWHGIAAAFGVLYYKYRRRSAGSVEWRMNIQVAPASRMDCRASMSMFMTCTLIAA